MSTWSIHPGDTRASLARLPERSVRCCVTSPTGAVAVRHGRNYIGCELNPAYIKLSEARIGAEAPLFVNTGVVA